MPAEAEPGGGTAASSRAAAPAPGLRAFRSLVNARNSTKLLNDLDVSTFSNRRRCPGDRAFTRIESEADGQRGAYRKAGQGARDGRGDGDRGSGDKILRS